MKYKYISKEQAKSIMDYIQHMIHEEMRAQRDYEKADDETLSYFVQWEYDGSTPRFLRLTFTVDYEEYYEEE